MTITLYYHPLTCSLGAQISLLAAKLPHRLVEVDLAGDRTFYKRINLAGTVPALEINEVVLTETTAILFWISQVCSQARLLPNSASGQARGISFLSWLASSVQISRRQIKMPARFTESSDGVLGVQAKGQLLFTQYLQQIDSLLSSQNWVLSGEAPTVCDYQLMAYANWCALDGIELSALRHLQRWQETMLLRSEVRQALEVIHSPLLSLGK